VTSSTVGAISVGRSNDVCGRGPSEQSHRPLFSGPSITATLASHSATDLHESLFDTFAAKYLNG